MNELQLAPTVPAADPVVPLPVLPAAVPATTDPVTGCVLGLGHSGVAMVELLLQRGLPPARAVVAAGDPAAIATSAAGRKLGLPSGRAALAVAEMPAELATCLQEFGAAGGNLFLIAGLGGTTATHWAPRAARAAKEAGARVFAFVTLPFDFEGSARKGRARQAVEELRESADGVLCLPSEVTRPIAGNDAALDDTFAVPSSLLVDALMGLRRLVMCPAKIRLHPDDLCAALRTNPAGWLFGTACAEGPKRAADAAEALLRHPLMDGGEALRRAGEIILSVAATQRLPALDLQRLNDRILQHVGEASVTTTVSMDETLGERLSVLALVGAPPLRSERASESSEASVAPGADSALLPMREVVPPGRAITPMALADAPLPREAATIRRKSDTTPRQTQLPLDISGENRSQKNPFQAGEATIHKGQNLDLPTYLRHSTPLN